MQSSNEQLESSKEELQALNEELSTVNAQLEERAKGWLGLGLTLAQQLVQLHAGPVQAESGGLGAGSTFTVRLPFLRLTSALPTPDSALPGLIGIWSSRSTWRW